MKIVNDERLRRLCWQDTSAAHSLFILERRGVWIVVDWGTIVGGSDVHEGKSGSLLLGSQQSGPRVFKIVKHGRLGRRNLYFVIPDHSFTIVTQPRRGLFRL